MSCDPAIVVRGLNKTFHIYSKPRDRLLQMLVRNRRKYFREFWALTDVSFQVMHGETVGIVGRNGSGKSTLLQLICGTLNPSGGSIETHGRIAALLELGSGFNPEFTGRENVYMYAAVLGLSKAETEQRYDEIVSFSGIKEFIDQPVKTYSSGMVVRLAFSVAINVDPQILIVDEALSVGDELFQRKCFAKIETIKQKGTTILFVSHSGGTVIELCDRAILLDSGKLLSIGRPKRIVEKYHKLLYAPDDKRQGVIDEICSDPIEQQGANQDAPVHIEAPITTAETIATGIFDPGLVPTSTVVYESRGATIQGAHIRDMHGNVVNGLIRGKRYEYCFDVTFQKPATLVRFGMLIKNRLGVELGGSVSASSILDGINKIEVGHTVHATFSFTCSLNPGTYFLNAGVLGIPENGEETYLHRVLDASMFRVIQEPDDRATGTIDFNCSFGSHFS